MVKFNDGKEYPIKASRIKKIKKNLIGKGRF